MNLLASTCAKAILTFSLLAGLCLGARSQQNPVDTFDAWFKKEPNDSIRLERATRISKYFENIDTSVSWKYYRVAKQIADQKNTDAARMRILELEGVLHTKSNPGKAYTLYQEAIEICRSLKS